MIFITVAKIWKIARGRSGRPLHYWEDGRTYMPGRHRRSIRVWVICGNAESNLRNEICGMKMIG